jgi:hypothetical protein
MDKAIETEIGYFVETVQSPQARAMVRTLFQSLPALRKGPPGGDAKPSPRWRSSVPA